MRAPNMMPNTDNGSLANRLATEKEIKRALKLDKNAEIIEIPIINMTYVISYRYGVMVRCSMMGGDTFDVECGWYYVFDTNLRKDVQELRYLASLQA